VDVPAVTVATAVAIEAIAAATVADASMARPKSISINS
jgi:hypothetical protein